MKPFVDTTEFYVDTAYVLCSTLVKGTFLSAERTVAAFTVRGFGQEQMPLVRVMVWSRAC